MSIADTVRAQLKECHIFLNGRYVESACKHRIDVNNPATGELLTTVADSTAEDVNAAVRAARESFEKKSWRGMVPSKRERILWRAGDLIAEHREELAALVSLESGKTLREAAGADVNPAADAFRYYAG